jgi:hypothetical protein
VQVMRLEGGSASPSVDPGDDMASDETMVPRLGIPLPESASCTGTTDGWLLKLGSEELRKQMRNRVASER